MAKKQELVHFLETKVFNPILQASPDRYSENDRRKLDHVQRSTQTEKERFHGYSSAEDVRNNYLSDLNSDAAKRINRELKELGLPRLPDVKDDFLKLADK